MASATSSPSSPRIHPSAAVVMALAGLGGALAGFASSSFAWCQMAAATVWIMVKDSFEYLMRKDYESAQTAEEREASRNTRINGFLSISSLGLGTMCCGGAAKVFEHVKTNHPKQALYCVVYLTFTALCQLVGLIAVTFLSDFPWAFFMFGLGEWQSAIFLLALLHLDVMEYYEEHNLAEYSMVASSLIVSFFFYWSVGPQDRRFLHFTGKLLIRTVYILFTVLCWTVFLIAKLLAFMVWLQFFLSRQLRRTCWNIRND